MKNLLTFLLPALGILHLSCTGDKVNAIQLTAADSNKTITATVDTEIILRLPANSSTGYSWTVKEQGGLTLTADSYETDPRYRDREGAGGTHTFHFRAAKRGRSDLYLLYYRSWETDGWAQRYRVTIDVK